MSQRIICPVCGENLESAIWYKNHMKIHKYFGELANPISIILEDHERRLKQLERLAVLKGKLGT